MNPIQGSCPSCGAKVEFKVGTALVTVCEYCRSVVGRGDRKLEDLGKIADVTETGSPLDLWLKGRYNGVPFDLTGRVQYSHPAGGTWDEWYAHFADGRWGWLAEAMGRFYLTFETPSPELPVFDDLVLGQKVTVGVEPVTLQVAEKNVGRTIAARGEIPYRLEPNVSHPFADCYGPDRAFATLDYSDEQPTLYLGKEVTLDDLGIPKGAKAGRRDERRVEALALSCPNCGGALALRAPNDAQRVGCPNCGSLLDVNDRQLSLLESLHPPRVQPAIPLGTVAEFEGAKLTTLGYMQRSVRIEGETYYWMEYLLYEPRLGYRWLVQSDNHWNYVRALPPGEIEGAGLYNSSVSYGGRSFKLFQQARCRVEFVIGEFYWKVRAGEEVWGRDFIAPPEMLSQEISSEGSSGEINWSLGRYFTVAEVEQACNVKQLPSPTGVGPNQPFPYSGVYRQFGLFLAAAFLLFLATWMLVPKRTLLTRRVPLPPILGTESSRHVLTDDQPIEIQGGRNVRVTLRSLASVWVYVDGEFAPRGGARRTNFSLAADAFGRDTVYLSALPAGSYLLDLRFQWADVKQPADAEILVEQGVLHAQPLVILLCGLALVPVLVALYHGMFESQRWENSSLADSDLPPRVRAVAATEAPAAVAPISRSGDKPNPRWLRKLKERQERINRRRRDKDN